MNLAELRDHWEAFGRTFPKDSKVTPTSRDPYLGELEEAQILPYLTPQSVVLDIGCGDASHTIRYARKCRQITGLDVAPSLIELAESRAQEAGLTNAGFLCESVTELARRFSPGQFDCVVSQRCLINLPDWSHQQDALRQIHTILRPGGLLLITEGFNEPLAELNSLRSAVGLSEIKVVDYNRNFSQPAFESFGGTLFDVAATGNYGAYLMLSRVLHPLAVRPEAPRHDGPINAAAALLAAHLDPACLAKYSYNLFYALRKRG